MSIREFLTKLQNFPDQRKKIILWSVVAVLAIAMGAFWIKGAMNSLDKIGQGVGQIKLSEISNDQLPIPNEISNDQNSNAETADWNTYVNDDLGYGFKYPKELIGFTGIENKTDDYIFGACDSQNNFCVYTNIIMAKQSSFNDYVDAFKKINYKYIIKVNSSSISGKNAVFIEEDRGSEKGISIFIDFGSPLIISLVVGAKDKTDADISYSDANNIFEQIISTFKFLETK